MDRCNHFAQVPEPNIVPLIMIGCGAFTFFRRRGPRS